MIDHYLFILAPVSELKYYYVGERLILIYSIAYFTRHSHKAVLHPLQLFKNEITPL